mmetsp:Transcript_58799/g.161363  ORF Transcript_58799/g.161363 Transcript_58799/m.161363 type:complete len:248 (-) Transcript_58799:544-1287(-)
MRTHRLGRCAAASCPWHPPPQAGATARARPKALATPNSAHTQGTWSPPNTQRGASQALHTHTQGTRHAPNTRRGASLADALHTTRSTRLTGAAHDLEVAAPNAPVLITRPRTRCHRPSRSQPSRAGGGRGGGRASPRTLLRGPRPPSHQSLRASPRAPPASCWPAPSPRTPCSASGSLAPPPASGKIAPRQASGTRRAPVHWRRSSRSCRGSAAWRSRRQSRSAREHQVRARVSCVSPPSRPLSPPP